MLPQLWSGVQQRLKKQGFRENQEAFACVICRDIAVGLYDRQRAVPACPLPFRCVFD